MIHGGDVYTNGVLKGRELLDFSSNINPLGVPESFKNNLQEAFENVTRYPDIKYREVLKSLNLYTGIAKENFILGNGAAEVIDLCISCFRNILIVVPSFVEYELDAKKYNCNIEYSYLKEDKTYNYEEIISKIKKSDALIIGNPNNPNGCIIDKKQFSSILNYCEENHKTIIIDEAFIEFVGDESQSFLQETKSFKSLFIIRALTKFFGMPGIRFGYGISEDKDLLKKIRDKQNPWNINCFAEVAVKYVLKDKEYIEESLKWIKEEREFLTSELRKIKLIDKIYETKANYILVKLKEIDCHKLYEICLEKGILIRKAHNYEGLDENYVRFAIKDREKNLKLLEVLREINN